MPILLSSFLSRQFFVILNLGYLDIYLIYKHLPELWAQMRIFRMVNPFNGISSKRTYIIAFCSM